MRRTVRMLGLTTYPSTFCTNRLVDLYWIGPAGLASRRALVFLRHFFPLESPRSLLLPGLSLCFATG